MDMREHVTALNETRLRVWNEAQGFLEDVRKRHPGEEMSAEERAQWDRYNERIDAIDAEVRNFVDRETAERDAAALRETHAQVFGSDAKIDEDKRNEEDQFRAWARGDLRRTDDPDEPRKNAFQISARDLMLARREREMLRSGASADEIRVLLWDTGSIASAVPTTMARSLYQILDAQIAMFRAPTTKIQTASGENMDFPKLVTHSIATQVSGQGTALAGTDPDYGKVTLGAFKYGELIRVANEVVTDTVFDVTGHVSAQIGRAIGRVIDTDLVTGSGSGKPLGIMASGGTGSAGTVATGGSLVDPTYEKLVDVVYSINDEYRMSGACGWLMRDSTAGTLRKLRDGAGGTEGSPLWTPSLTNGLPGQGQPDSLLTFPVFVDANVASLASNAKIIGFGDFSAYYVRQVGGVVIERDDSRFFDTDEIAFRGKWRIDGDLLDNTAWNILKRSV